MRHIIGTGRRAMYIGIFNNIGCMTSPELQDIERQIHGVNEEARDLVRRLSGTQFNWRAAPGQWSIAQCLEHLAVTAQLELPHLERAISQAIQRQQFATGPFRYGRLGSWFVRSLEPPVKFKVKTTKPFAPPSADRRVDEVLGSYLQAHEEVLDLRRSDGLDLARVRVTSAFVRYIHFSLGHAFAMIPAHARRHLWQARQVQGNAEFPVG